MDEIFGCDFARNITEAAADLAERQGTLSSPLRVSAPVTFGTLHLGPGVEADKAEIYIGYLAGRKPSLTLRVGIANPTGSPSQNLPPLP